MNTSLVEKEKDLLAVAQQESALKNKISKLEGRVELNKVHYDDLFEKNQSLKNAREDI